MVPQQVISTIMMMSLTTSSYNQGIALSLAVIDRSSPDSANEQYVPWTRQSQGRPPMLETIYIPLTAPLDRSPLLP